MIFKNRIVAIAAVAWLAIVPAASCASKDGAESETGVTEKRLVAEQEATLQLKESLPASIRAAWAGGSVDYESGTRRWYVTSRMALVQLRGILRQHPRLHVTAMLASHSDSELTAASRRLFRSIRSRDLVVAEIRTDIKHNQLIVKVPKTDALLEEYSVGGRPSAPTAQDNAEDARRLARNFTESSGIDVRVVSTSAPMASTL